jgi:hypothetical protein
VLKKILFCSLLSLYSLLPAQTYLGVNVGEGVGWWLQESNASNVNGSAWDRSHLNFSIPLELTLEKQMGKRIRMGTYLFFNPVNDYEIVGSTDLWYNSNRIPVSKGWFTMLGGGIKGQYNLFSTSNIDLYGAGQLGFFHLNTNHPDKLGFEKKYTFALGTKLVIKKKKVEYTISPTYSEYGFNNTLQENGRHKMYFLNFMFGINYKISDIE